MSIFTSSCVGRPEAPDLRPLAELGLRPRPMPRPFRQRDAEPNAGRHDHPAVFYLQMLIEQRVEPVEMFHPGLELVGCCKVKVDLHGEMRDQLQLLGFCKGADLQELGYAGNPKTLNRHYGLALKIEHLVLDRVRGRSRDIYCPRAHGGLTIVP